MLTAVRDLLSRVVLLGVSERDDGEERLRKAAATLIAVRASAWCLLP